MRGVTRLRYIDGKGQKRAEYALSRRDTSPRYQGDPEPLICPYCDAGLAHSMALHEHMTAAGQDEGGEAL